MPASINTIAIRLLALLVFSAAAFGIAVYPFAKLELAFGLAAYAIAGLWRPYLMLFMIPVWLAMINLAPWSGSLYLEDYDLLLGVTLAVFLARGLYGMQARLTLLQWFSIFLLAIATLTGFARGFFPAPEWQHIELSSYYSHWNALRLAKGFFWALLLLPAISALLHSQRDKSLASLAWGLAFAGAVVGIAAMWERHVFHAIAEAGSRYEILGNLLDFTTPYRITGLFSEMHTGGEAIDGFIALVWPFGLLALMVARTKVGVAFASLALLCALYAAVTTFSRASYLALAAGLVAGVFLLLWSRRNRQAAEKPPFLALLGLLVPVTLAYIHTKGGVISLGAVLMAWGGALLTGYLVSSGRKSLGFAFLGVLVVAACYGVARGMLTSKWVVNEFTTAWSIAAILSLLAVATGYWTGRNLVKVIRPRVLALLLLLVIGGSAVVVPALLGSRMETRFSTNREDVSGRGQHWKTTLNIMKSDWATHLFGMGIGRFPQEYLFAKSGEHGNYGFRQEDGKTLLLLGGGEDMTFGQRISLPAWKAYTLTMNARTNDASANLRVRICRRHILVPFDWNPQCVSMNQTLKNSDGEWQNIVWPFEMGALGEGAAFGRRPLLLELMNYQYRGDKRAGTKLEIEFVSITDQQGKERVANGNFSRALERWFPYYDFEHMPWHVKNLWVNVYFEQGWLGLSGFIAFLLSSVFAAVRYAAKGGLWGVAMFSVLVSYMSVGMFGGLIDVPRVVFLFYLLGMVTMLVSNTGSGSKPVSNGTRSSHKSHDSHRDRIQSHENRDGEIVMPKDSLRP